MGADLEPGVRLKEIRSKCLTVTHEFVVARCRDELGGHRGGGFVADALTSFLAGGKFLRPVFAYIGWTCGGAESDAALRAAGSLELLHCFALVQDDVMDGSSLRRGKPALHRRMAQWHREEGLSGSPEKFGESAAVLLADLFLVWSERMLRECGLPAAALSRGWPRYDDLRAELAVGQFSDLVNDAGRAPGWDSVLDVLRRKSGNYTVRRPLEFGAALAGCGEQQLAGLSAYGRLVGEAFQFRDDLLGVFGDPRVTGKPVGEDLRDRKATSVVVLAAELADPAQARELRALTRLDAVEPADVRRWQALIAATGAPGELERMIGRRSADALEAVERAGLPDPARAALAELASSCTERAR
ncbi:polyprenyl synthetase family protein [Amycolatopsis sp. NPDC048633]|uniref:polyprenyl synthetase family protein n=1 Tax=Amycolatopsis sp. NPDC048633 TaxID=3157095 RepID=UPI0033E2ACB1